MRIVVVIQALHGSIATRRKYKGKSSMNCRERGSHARGVYPTHGNNKSEARERKKVDRSVIARE